MIINVLTINELGEEVYEKREVPDNYFDVILPEPHTNIYSEQERIDWLETFMYESGYTPDAI